MVTTLCIPASTSVIDHLFVGDFAQSDTVQVVNFIVQHIRLVLIHLHNDEIYAKAQLQSFIFFFFSGSYVRYSGTHCSKRPSGV